MALTSVKKMTEILTGLCDAQQEEFRRQIALAFPDGDCEEITNAQVDIIEQLNKLHDASSVTVEI